MADTGEKLTPMMRQYLEDTGLFTVDVARTRYLWRGEEHAEFVNLQTERVIQLQRHQRLAHAGTNREDPPP